MSYIPIAASPEYSTVTLQVGLKERLRCLHISDTHLLFSDGRDCRAKYDVALRRWGEYVYANVGRNVTYFLDALLYAKRNGLLLLHTGDLIDFYSPANLEAAERLLELAGVNCFLCAGNHEYTNYSGQHPESREEARRALDLPVDGRILTLACGSMGAGPLRTTAQKVAELMGPEDLLVTICGSNHRMYQQMQSDFFRPVDRVRVLGYTHEMFRYMYASDLLLTKAGGLTTAEAVAAGTPLLYLNAVPGCESHNIDFRTRHGCALAVGSDGERQPMLQGKRVLMVGDRNDDMRGAADCGLDAAGALYGYGNREELAPFHPVLLAERCADPA
mgnify:CR=1 FL=1